MSDRKPTASDFDLPAGWPRMRKGKCSQEVWSRILAYHNARRLWNEARETPSETRAREEASRIRAKAWYHAHKKKS